MDDTLVQYRGLLADLMSAEFVDFASGTTKSLPRTGGVYRVCKRGQSGIATIYVGKSKNLRRRVHGDHLLGDRVASTLKRKLIRDTPCEDEADVKQFLTDNCCVQYIEIEEERERTWFEHFAVAMLRPPCND